MSNSPAHLVRNDISESILQTNIINKDLSLNRVWPPSTSTLLTSTASLATNKSAAEFASCFKISLTFERTTGGREEKLLDQKRSIRLVGWNIILLCSLRLPTPINGLFVPQVGSETLSVRIFPKFFLSKLFNKESRLDRVPSSCSKMF